MEPRQADVSIPLQSSGWGAKPRCHPSEPPPRDFVLWSAFNVLLWSAVCGLGCLGLPALIYSVKARDCKVVGDLEGARHHGGRAKTVNIICSVLAALTLVTAIIIVAVAIAMSSIRHT